MNNVEQHPMAPDSFAGLFNGQLSALSDLVKATYWRLLRAPDDRVANDGVVERWLIRVVRWFYCSLQGGNSYYCL